MALEQCHLLAQHDDLMHDVHDNFMHDMHDAG